MECFVYASIGMNISFTEHSIVQRGSKHSFHCTYIYRAFHSMLPWDQVAKYTLLRNKDLSVHGTRLHQKSEHLLALKLIP